MMSDEPLLYLIGVNHAMQFKSMTAQMFGESESVRKKREAFTAHVAEMIDKLAFEILAEEWSDEAKHKPAESKTAPDEQSTRAMFEAELVRCNYETVLEQFSKAKDIEHRFCDPTSSEKQALGIEVDPRKETDSDRDPLRRARFSSSSDRCWVHSPGLSSFCSSRRVVYRLPTSRPMVTRPGHPWATSFTTSRPTLRPNWLLLSF